MTDECGVCGGSGIASGKVRADATVDPPHRGSPPITDPRPNPQCDCVNIEQCKAAGGSYLIEHTCGGSPLAVFPPSRPGGAMARFACGAICCANFSVSIARRHRVGPWLTTTSCCISLARILEQSTPGAASPAPLRRAPCRHTHSVSPIPDLRTSVHSVPRVCWHRARLRDRNKRRVSHTNLNYLVNGRHEATCK